MKRTIILTFTAIILLGLSFFSCTGRNGDSSSESATVNIKQSPSEVMTKALKAIQNKDYKGCLQYVADLEEATDEDIDGLSAFIGMVYETNNGLKSFEILNEEISEDGQNATVYSKCIYGNGEIKEDEDQLIMTQNGWRLKI